MKIKNRKSRGLTSKNRITGRSKKKVKKAPVGWLTDHWDSSKSSKYNYGKLGISEIPDEIPGIPFNRAAFSGLVTGSEYVPTTITVQDWQRNILEVMRRKYGDNYKAMAKDIKINSWQWTKIQIKKLMDLAFR